MKVFESEEAPLFAKFESNMPSSSDGLPSNRTNYESLRSVTPTSVLYADAVSNAGHYSAKHQNEVTERTVASTKDGSSIFCASASPVSVEEDSQPTQKIGILPLAVLVFYTVSGGAFGCEATVRYGGTFYALLGFALLPFLWSLPEALMTAELGSAYPEAAGGVVWVETAFGKRAGAIAGYLSWVGGVTDNAIYPALFLEYVHSMVGFQTSGVVRYLIVTGIALLLSLINYLGLDIVGNVIVVVCAITMSPFILLSLFGSVDIDPSRWMQMPDPSQLPTEELEKHAAGLLSVPNFGGVIWRPFLNNMFWSLNAYDSAANFAGEVNEPGRVFPRALFISFVMAFCSYLIPMLVATGATASSQSDWVEGHLASIASEVVGPWLGAWTVFSSGVSNIALYEAEMSSDAFQMMGLAQRGMAPQAFAHRSRFGTPTYGILVGTCIVLLLNTADFTAIVEMLNFTYSISLLMEYAAFVKLRFSHDHVCRPYRVPVGRFGVICLVTPPVILTGLLMLMASWDTFMYCFIVACIGSILQKWNNRRKARGQLHDALGTNESCTSEESSVVGDQEFCSDDAQTLPFQPTNIEVV